MNKGNKEGQHKLVTIISLEGTEGLSIHFSPNLIIAEQLFADTKKFLDSYDHEGSYTISLEREEFLTFLRDQATIPPLFEAEEALLLELVEFAWNLILRTIDQELGGEYQRIEKLLEQQQLSPAEETEELEVLAELARIIIQEECLSPIAEEAIRRVYEYKQNRSTAREEKQP